MHGMGKRWEGGKIYYLNLINPQLNEVLFIKVNQAVAKWNQWNAPHCLFEMATMETPYVVNFMESQAPV